MHWSWDAMARMEEPVSHVDDPSVSAVVEAVDPVAAGARSAARVEGRNTRVATAAFYRRSGWLRTAAAVVFFLAGGLAGFIMRGDRSAASPPEGPTFLLLVRGTEPDATMPVETLVQEYSAWAGELAAEGRLVAAEKLVDDSGRWISGSSAESRSRSDVSGYFVISAADYAQAEDIARSSPHVRYGGTFEIRRIDPLE